MGRCDGVFQQWRVIGRVYAYTPTRACVRACVGMGECACGQEKAEDQCWVTKVSLSNHELSLVFSFLYLFDVSCGKVRTYSAERSSRTMLMNIYVWVCERHVCGCTCV